uniref:Uncharacterized protein n=1 Tax=Syphacia muris TaxID=451379 RepID=A0A0N5AV33_9BILA
MPSQTFFTVVKNNRHILVDIFHMYIRGDTDNESKPPSEYDSGEVPEPAVSILLKMEQMNTSNELDARSVASLRSGSSSSGGHESASPRLDLLYLLS